MNASADFEKWVHSKNYQNLSANKIPSVWLQAEYHFDNASLKSINSPITDGISNQLARLNHLESLNLNETNITKAGLIKLKQLPNLKRIYSWQT